MNASAVTTARVSRRLRKLALVVTFAAAALAAPAGLANASTVDPGVRCAAQTGPGQYEFFLPGERATDKDGNKWVCGPDGKWFRDYSSLQVPTNPTNPFTFVRAAAVTQVLATAVVR